MHIYPYLKDLKGAVFPANCDLDPGKARALAGWHGVPNSYTSHTEMIAREELDAVIMCVSEHFHGEVTPGLLEAGLHVYTEKPTAENLAQARRMVEASRRGGKVCMTGYKKRFGAAFVKAKMIIESANFGAPSLLTILRTKGRNDPAENYLWSWGCHCIDLLPFLFGAVRRVSTMRSREGNLAYAIQAEFANGAIGSLSVTNTTGGCWEEIHASGRGGESVMISNGIFMTHFHGEKPVDGHSPRFMHGQHLGHVEEGFVAELQEFIDAIRESRDPRSSIREAAHTLAIYEAIQKSAGLGTPVDVEPVE
jgi:predicted dehydrogenase